MKRNSSPQALPSLWLAQRWPWVGMLIALGLAFALFFPVLALPAFGSDGHWLALALDTPLDPFNFDWSAPPLFALLLHLSLRLFGDGAVVVLRWLALGSHLAIGLLLARWVLRQTHRPGAALATLVMVLFSPFAYRGLASLAFLPNLIAIILLLLAALSYQQRHRELALAALIASLFIISLHTAPAQTLFALFVGYGSVLLLAGLMGLALAKFVSPMAPIAPRGLSALLIATVALSGAAINRDWLSVYTQTSSADRVAFELARSPLPQDSLLMLNVPWAIDASLTSPALLGDDQQLWPTDLDAQQALLLSSTPITLTFGRINDGELNAPNTIANHPIDYGNQPIWSWQDLRPSLSAFDAIVLGREVNGQYQARVIGALGHSNVVPSTYMARFENKGSVILLTQMAQCQPNGVALTLWVQHKAESQSTVNLFRHALRGEAKIAGNDNNLLGGWLSLSALAEGEWVRDIAYFDDLTSTSAPDALRIGLYDWQTGERWLALHQDGAQWAENAVTLPRPSPLQPCASGK